MMMLIISNISYSTNVVNSLIISGQVINKEYGNPVEGHLIYIKNDDRDGGLAGYSRTLLTDSEGYYYDTIYTTVNKGSFKVTTYDYLGKIIDTTIHFRFMNDKGSISIANFLIYMPFQSHKLQARFKYVQKQNSNRNYFTFIDETKNENIIGWDWDFGDGETSKLQNPRHLYASSGLFKITLKVMALVNNVVKSSVISKQLYISEIEYFHLGGHVFSEYFPIDVGYAYLYMIDANERYIAIDTMKFDTLGYYYFYQIPKNNYIVKVEPCVESQYYGSLLPTYYGNKIFWEEADTICLQNTSWEYDIKLDVGNNIFGGDGQISGNVKYNGDIRSFDELSNKGINMYLLDNNNQLLTYSYSNDFGDFNFDFVALNTYWLCPEVTGIHTDKIKIELSNEVPVIDGIEITILANGISYVVPNPDNGNGDIVGTPYPNPTMGDLNINMDIHPLDVVSYKIYNMFGEKVASDKVGFLFNSSYIIPTGNLKNGSYILSIEINSNNYNRAFLLAR